MSRQFLKQFDLNKLTPQQLLDYKKELVETFYTMKEELIGLYLAIVRTKKTLREKQYSMENTIKKLEEERLSQLDDDDIASVHSNPEKFNIH